MYNIYLYHIHLYFSTFLLYIYILIIAPILDSSLIEFFPKYLSSISQCEAFYVQDIPLVQ